MAGKARHPGPALVWRRADFSETSRLVTLISRDAGRVTALAKGAHRPKSPFLGRLDYLNLVVPGFGRQKREGTLRLLRSVKLLHEPRALRAPERFLAAAHLAEVFDAAFLEGRADPELFDLLWGAILVLERCPGHALDATVAGVEVRFLHTLGLLPALDRCSHCGTAASRLHAVPTGGLACTEHRPADAPAVAASALGWMRQALQTPGRSWGKLPAPDPAAVALLGRWVSAAIERVPQMRRHAVPPPRRRAGAGSAQDRLGKGRVGPARVSG